jgi:hypothetical protein
MWTIITSEKRTAELKQKEKQIAVLKSKLDQKDAQIAGLATRLEAVELRQNQSIQVTAEQR